MSWLSLCSQYCCPARERHAVHVEHADFLEQQLERHALDDAPVRLGLPDVFPRSYTGARWQLGCCCRWTEATKLPAHPHVVEGARSAHLEAEEAKANQVGVAPAKDGHVRLSQSLPRVPDRCYADLPGHHRRSLPHLLGAASLGRRLDSPTLHGRALLGHSRQCLNRRRAPTSPVAPPAGNHENAALAGASTAALRPALALELRGKADQRGQAHRHPSAAPFPYCHRRVKF